MTFKLRITSGPLIGRECFLTPGTLIGRSSADFIIPDPKVSGRHAKVEKLKDGRLELIDLGSNNGIRVGDNRLLRLELTLGAKFRLGGTDFEVIQAEDPTFVAPPPPKNVPEPPKIEGEALPPIPQVSTGDRDDEATPLPPIPKKTEKPILTWRDYFEQLLNTYHKKVNNKERALRAFRPMVVLDFVQGLQAGSKWELGYGPRQVGIQSLDLPLFDTGAPAQAFTIEPDGADAIFKTQHPDRVRLNGKKSSSEKLLPGDEISFSDTRIKVSFK